MEDQSLEDNRTRLIGVAGGKWVFNPRHDMFVGHTNAIEMPDRTIDLGRDHKTWTLSSDPAIRGYVLSERSIENVKRNKSLGEFIGNSREDMLTLLEMLGKGW